MIRHGAGGGGLSQRLLVELPVDPIRVALVHVHPTERDRNHRPQHERVADDPHDVAPDMEVGHVRQAGNSSWLAPANDSPVKVSIGMAMKR
jgi:hypothetical protein